MATRWLSLWLLCSMLLGTAWLAGCKELDPNLLNDRVGEGPGPFDDGGTSEDGGGAGASGGTAGNGGMSGGQSGAGGESGSGGSAGAAGMGGGSACQPPPSDADPSCIEVCPERCNGEDDDCDGDVDEGAAAACELDNAVAVCVAGSCRIADCDDGFRDCDDDAVTGCETTDFDTSHCGTCGTKCVIAGAIPACVDGECVAAGCADDLLGDCNDASQDCETTLTSLDNCGACGASCRDLPNAAPTCDTGECLVSECALNYGDCNGIGGDGCEEALNSIVHCGDCDTPCDLPGSSGDDCDEYQCRAGTCDSGYKECNGNRYDGCESLSTTENCGDCGQLCSTSNPSIAHVTAASCSAGVCLLTCEPGWDDCNGDPLTDGCETPLDTLTDCGSCGTECARDNATATCAGGSCAIAQCNAPNWDDCNDVDADGCEQSLLDDTTCGSCDTNCVGTSLPVCGGNRTCTDFDCPGSLADCNDTGAAGDGCEVDTAVDAQNCGSCGFACTFTTGTPHATALSCVGGACEVSCQLGWEDCNGDYRDGCETPLTTLSNCGSCGQTCAIANATATCSTGQCRVASCNTDYADCNTDQLSCETRLNSVSNCNACGAACNLANATPACTGTAGSRSCTISSCEQFYANCDTQAGNGCEINLQTSVTNCGACSFNCLSEENVSTATCTGGSCNFTCNLGFADCNNVDNDGCETALTTLTNCGGCGIGCSRANGTASCATGSCQLAGCNSGFANCDGSAANGCESLSTITNCGACNDPCLPPNATGTCSTGTCAVSSCSSGWADCDGDPSNGCERNTATLGPCLPEANCVKQVYDGHDYFVCPTARTWSEARTFCQLQTFGDLVRIDDANENAFIASVVSGNPWLGATDSDGISVEGEWRWANDTALFWSGAANGSPQMGRYSAWSSGEPNDVGGEDCVEYIDSLELWNDISCTATRSYVCEIAGDLCPSDPSKTSPGQCGCGVADTDGDGDRTADCIDGCPSDASKVTGGACGCGVPDTDGDGDGTPNCNDACPSDPGKTAPGVCGCGTADTDSDGDGTPNCSDQCPSDNLRQAVPCSYPFTPSNFDPLAAPAIDFVSAPTANQTCGDVTVNTSGSVTITGWCGTAPTPVIRTQSGGPEVVILPLQGLTIPSGRTLTAVGARPLILAVQGDALIQGTISARAVGTAPGAGGNVSCSTSAGIGRNGGHDSDGDDGSGGGGGGGFGANGGSGGSGDAGSGGGAAGTTEGGSTLVPLRGGCQGGQGGRASTGSEGGGGGGAVALVVSQTLTVAGSGIITASGGGGRKGDSHEDGGGGGGSGGAVLLEAGTLSLATGSWVTANGGGGASGNRTDGTDGDPGDDGPTNNTSGGTGGDDGRSGSGNGGNGGGSSNASNGGNGSGVGCGWGCEDQGAGGGGGGGGRGRIRLRGTASCSLGGTRSPSATTTTAGVCQ